MYFKKKTKTKRLFQNRITSQKILILIIKIKTKALLLKLILSNLIITQLSQKTRTC